MKPQTVLKIIAFFVFLFLVHFGRKIVGAQGLGVQAIGLFGLLGLLYFYNRRYQ